MAEYTSFESRIGSVKASSADVYKFSSDLRNFGRFIPADKAGNVVLSETSCSFDYTGVGRVDLNLTEKNPFDRIVIKGTALQSVSFAITINIFERSPKDAEVKVGIQAELNPILKMMMSDPLKKFLEMLVVEMENFTGWKS